MEQPKSKFKIVSDKKTRMILPNAITLIGVCIGLSSIKFAIDGKFAIAIIAIMFAGLMDALDGRIARLIKGTSKMGKELDSLGDVISFGVAPALIMYFWNLQYLDKLGWFVCLIYVVCVALRLARFNVNTEEAVPDCEVEIESASATPDIFKNPLRLLPIASKTIDDDTPVVAEVIE